MAPKGQEINWETGMDIYIYIYIHIYIYTHTHTHTHIHMADSLCCTAESNTTLQTTILQKVLYKSGIGI